MGQKGRQPARRRGESQMENWYALRVRSNHERIVQLGLRGRGFAEFLPVYRGRARRPGRVETVERPLFPGYIFARFDAGNRMRVLTLPGVVQIVSFGRAPEPVSEAEFTGIKRVVESDLPMASVPYLSDGESVVVRDGPLSGLEGIVLRSEAGTRLVVSLHVLLRSVTVELDRDLLLPVAPRTREAACARG